MSCGWVAGFFGSTPPVTRAISGGILYKVQAKATEENSEIIKNGEVSPNMEAEIPPIEGPRTNPKMKAP